MNITPIKTHPITRKDTDILKILDRYVKSLKEGSILAITSKIISICEGRVVKMENADKDDLVRQEADFYLPREENKYGFFLTIKHNLLVPTAGIDESNGNGYYILWPSDAQRSANEIRRYLRKRFSLKNVGVLITDSKTTPLRRGVTGAAIAWSGFSPLRDYRGTEDIFGRELKVTKVNVADALASAAVLVMGEGKERTPLAVIEDVLFMDFKDEDPSSEELEEFRIAMEDDLYAPMFKSVQWREGGRRNPPSL